MSKTDLSASELQRYFQSASFSISAAKFEQCPEPSGYELAFAGRSNAGKSSAINRICSNKKLARTSKTPGRTQLINFFDLNDGQRLVDLPGYGFAKVSISKKQQWQRHLMRYLEDRPALAALVLLVDCRHPLQEFDQLMLDWATQYHMPCIVLLTKADKLSRNAAKQAQFNLEKQLANNTQVTVQLFSALNDTGLNEARTTIYAHLHPKTTAPIEQKIQPDD